MLGDDALVPAPAIVSVGHALNYLATEELVFDVLEQCAAALAPGGLLLLDLLDRSYAESRADLAPIRWEGEGWEMQVTFSSPRPDRFVRDIALTWTAPDGTVVDDHERHENVLIDADAAVDVLAAAGLTAELRHAFGEEILPEGFVVLHGVRAPGGLGMA